MVVFVLEKMENIMENGENAGNEYFFYFPTMISEPFILANSLKKTGFCGTGKPIKLASIRNYLQSISSTALPISGITPISGKKKTNLYAIIMFLTLYSINTHFNASTRYSF